MTAPRLSLSRPSLRRAPLLTLLLALAAMPAQARVRLGEALPAHPWASPGREVIVVYSHDCGDLGELWRAILASGLPVRAVNAEDIPAPAPVGVNVWRGDDATAFARTLRVGTYPAVILVQGGRILNAWEGTFQGDLGLTGLDDPAPGSTDPGATAPPRR